MLKAISTLNPFPAATRYVVRRYTPLTTAQKKNPRRLLHTTVQYFHFDTSRQPFMGTVIEVNATKTQVLVEPDAGQAARFPRWRSVSDILARVTFK